jgi:hypothetical protein
MRHGGRAEEKQYEVATTGALKSILVDVVSDPSKIRFEGIGDWMNAETGNRLVIVAELPNPDMTLALAIHEIVEQHLCHRNSVSTLSVDLWDEAYTGDEEPGEVPGAPYFDEHAAAIVVEKCVCETLGVDWEDYLATLTKVFNG